MKAKSQDEPAFSQRMLENHLSQDHDWASRRLTVIEQQVTWITRQLPAGARILDLGCGPGFYTRLLAERGFHCTGVDFSPASITWARQQAQAANLNIDYIQQDIRTYHPTEPFDFIMMTFGELNVFSAADAQSLISHCAQWLKPDGKLLVEVHTFDEVKRRGMAQPLAALSARPVSCRASSAVNGKCRMKRPKPAQRSSGR